MIDLNHLDDLHQATTPGPWEIDEYGGDIICISPSGYVYNNEEQNIAWIVALHEAWTALRDELKRLRECKAAVIDAYERAAQACEEMAAQYPTDVFPTSEAADWARRVAGNCAAAIRALKEET